jgi:FkbM family methyltransferase
LATELIKVGDVVWDIGANVGYFSFAAAGVSGVKGRVLSIEPDYWLVELLHRSANANGDRMAKVDVLPVAVSNSQGIKRFHIAARGRAANYLEGANLREARASNASALVPTVTLDWLLEHCSAPSVLKIDVEGAEAQVLQGAERLLNTVRPAILCEVGSENSAQVSECLSANGYLLFDADCPKAQREPLRRAPWNTLAIPEDR